MSGGSGGMSGHNFDAFVSSQRTFNEYDLAAKIQEKYWRARQKFLAKIEKKEDACIVLSDSKLDAKLQIYQSIDKSCASLTTILESYQNSLFVFANEENSLGILLKECSKHDKTKAGKIMSIAGKSLTQSSHQRIRLYMPLMRVYQEMDTFHSRAVDDTAETVRRLESKRSQYRASLLWMKDISERLDPDVFKQLDKFRRVQNQVRSEKKAFDGLQMDVVQKIDLLMASRCNLLNQILASYQSTLLETLDRNYNNFKSVEELIKKEDIYEYEFKALKQLNPLKIDDTASIAEETPDLMQEQQINNNEDILDLNSEESHQDSGALIDVSLDDHNEVKQKASKLSSDFVMDELDTLFGDLSKPAETNSEAQGEKKEEIDLQNPTIGLDLLNLDTDEQIANLLGPSEKDAKTKSIYGEPVDNNGGNSGSADLIRLDDIDNSSFFKLSQGLEM